MVTITASPTDRTADAMTPIPLCPVAPVNGSMLRVRTSPLVKDHSCGSFVIDDGAERVSVISSQLVLDYTKAVAIRAAGMVRDYHGRYTDQPHLHPQFTPCLRCVVMEASRSRTLAATVLEAMVESGADEVWNNTAACNRTNTESRLRRLAISEATMERLYGPFWGDVLVMALRIENSDPALVRHLINRFKPGKTLTPTTQATLAAYHVGVIATLGSEYSDDEDSVIQRNAAATKLACAMGKVAIGEAPEWMDHLAEPAL